MSSDRAVPVTSIMLKRGLFAKFSRLQPGGSKVITFTSAATTFYLLHEGERLQEHHIYGDYNRIYAVWPSGGQWAVRYRWGKGWEEITPLKFATQDEAFSFAYEHFLKKSS
ncbi:hypothetical protein LXA19_17450 [Erwinia amylovora]|uniref:hypothetical protein n=1 Tax=Erwinia amylovora TaxID=552 RepID=UPI0020BDAB3A|nr:hypothetical protein [Erwinia amylovora]MCK8373810.1 hypothetical protein [Erwinia amylovora]